MLAGAGFSAVPGAVHAAAANLTAQKLADGLVWIRGAGANLLALKDPQGIVFIEAPRHAIEGVLRKHAKVRELVENGWLYLFQMDAEQRSVQACAFQDGACSWRGPRASALA